MPERGRGLNQTLNSAFGATDAVQVLRAPTSQPLAPSKVASHNGEHVITAGVVRHRTFFHVC